jgi:hypothetical protein
VEFIMERRTALRVREARAIEMAWQFFVRNEGDIPFSEVVTRVRAHCPEVDPARIRLELERRLTTVARKGGMRV